MSGDRSTLAAIQADTPNPDTGIDLNASKLRTSCKELAKASYACLEKQTGPEAKSACQPFFTAYKECRKAEHNAPQSTTTLYATTEKTSQDVNFLLAKAVDIVKATSRSKKQDPLQPPNNKLVPVLLSFSTNHVQKIVLGDKVAAGAYLSLPASQYSVLSTALVARSKTSPEDTFVLSLPLGDLSTGKALYGGTKTPKISAIATTEVKVTPLPDEGKVKMESGPIFFVPSTIHSGNDSKINSLDNNSSSATTVFPEWLVWGGNNAKEVEEAESDGTAIRAKSSVQAGFVLMLEWSPSEVAKSSLSRSGSSSSSVGAKAEGKEDEEEEEEEELNVKASINVWVQFCLPVKEDLAGPLNFPPVRILIEQAGRLTASAILKTIAPTLGKMLIKDHDTRRGKMGRFQKMKIAEREKVARTLESGEAETLLDPF